ncbi:MAG TPA: VOC family protein [Acidimicrobiales bacterium]|jgi:4a-hydroxytetrahydrobiopterin dehydratase|nr:VOC family protein [Acidimicrobiales bacterium]
MTMVTNQQLLDAGLDDWRKLAQGLHARFEAPTFVSGAVFVGAIGRVAGELDHAPEVRMTSSWVEVKLTTEEDGWWVTDRDVELARRISQIARDEGLSAQPRAVMQVEVGLDTADHEVLAPFWAALLTGGLDNVFHGDVMDPDCRVPNVWFQDTEPHDVPRQRFHLDVWLPQDVAEERIAAAVAAGGRIVDDSQAPSFVVLADPDGNKACVCTCLGR